MRMIAVALTALVAAPGPTGWQRVERLKPGETIRVVRESVPAVDRRFAGFDGQRVWVPAPGFRRLSRSMRSDVVAGLSYVPRAMDRVVHDNWTIGLGPTQVARTGVLRAGAIVPFDDVFERIDVRDIVEIDRDVHPQLTGAMIGAMIGIVHGLIAGIDVAAERGSTGDGVQAFVGGVAIDSALGYLISKDRSRFEVVYRR